jgi:hypothetical protein
MRRTIETAHCIFKTHPNFEKIRFVVMPHSRETLTGSGDVSLDLDAKLASYSAMFPTGLDLTYVERLKEEKHFWQLESLSSREEIKATIKLSYQEGRST